MYNLVLFCKSYMGDIERLRILKESIDKFNVDNIPFFVCVPQRDVENIKKILVTGKEEYILELVTDEQILEQTNDHEQSWFSQQVIKLSLHKLLISNFFAVFDSDCYFITNFFTKDFMLDENTPYTIMKRYRGVDDKNNPHQIIKKFFNRKGLPYNWAAMPTIMSSNVLYLFEEYRNNKHLKISDLLNISPFEFNWYGEFLYFSKCLKIVPTDCLFYSFWYEKDYLDFRKYHNIDDIINMGYLGINLQAGWVKEKIYKPSIFLFFYKLHDYIIDVIYSRKPNNMNILKLIEFYFRKLFKEPIRNFIRSKNAKSNT